MGVCVSREVALGSHMSKMALSQKQCWSVQEDPKALRVSTSKGRSKNIVGVFENGSKSLGDEERRKAALLTMKSNTQNTIETQSTSKLPSMILPSIEYCRSIAASQNSPARQLVTSSSSAVQSSKWDVDDKVTNIETPLSSDSWKLKNSYDENVMSGNLQQISAERRSKQMRSLPVIDSSQKKYNISVQRLPRSVPNSLACDRRPKPKTIINIKMPFYADFQKVCIVISFICYVASLFVCFFSSYCCFLLFVEKETKKIP